MRDSRFPPVRVSVRSAGRVVVFLGPSAPAPLVTRALEQTGRDVDVLPPARLGDVWRAAFDGRVAGILLVDGLYESVPAVWHKEILAVLDRGIAVYGAASIGALRAAELDDFGMVGVGWVYERFRSGALDADDEVAVMHAPAQGGWRPLSVPLVNLRATMAAAIEAGILEPAAAHRIASAAKAVFYPERTWETLLRDAPAEFVAWVAEGHDVDVKRADTLAACHLIARDLRDETQIVAPVSDRLVVTGWWHRFLASSAASGAAMRPD